MHFRSRFVSITVMCVLILMSLVSRAFGSLAGTYVADNRSRELLFLAVTQSGHALSGALTDGKGGTTATVPL
jgi:hypothetical protein